MPPLLDAWYDLRSLANPISSLIEWLGDHTTDGAAYVVAAVIGATGILLFVGLAALINVWLERRIIGRIQVRRGPNRVGPFGLLQPLADAIKLIQKEVLQPKAADNKLFNLPPVIVFIPAMLSFAVFAWAPDMVYADLNVGVLYVLALSSVSSLAIFVAGWSSNNKYALLGAMRVIAMAISYEIPLVLALINVAIVAVEVFIWRYWDVTDWILAAYVVVNFALTIFFIGMFFRIITAGFYKMPRRVRLVGDIGVPSMPAPGATRP